jgi:hypothetical protein
MVLQRRFRISATCSELDLSQTQFVQGIHIVASDRPGGSVGRPWFHLFRFTVQTPDLPDFSPPLACPVGTVSPYTSRTVEKYYRGFSGRLRRVLGPRRCWRWARDWTKPNRVISGHLTDGTLGKKSTVGVAVFVRSKFLWIIAPSLTCLRADEAEEVSPVRDEIGDGELCPDDRRRTAPISPGHWRCQVFSRYQPEAKCIGRP